MLCDQRYKTAIREAKKQEKKRTAVQVKENYKMDETEVLKTIKTDNI